MGANGTLVVGAGFGAPFAIAGVWDQNRGNQRFNALDQELFSIDIAPTIAYRPNDKISFGAALDLQSFTFLKLQSLLNVSALGFTGRPAIRYRSRPMTIPASVPPWEFDTSFDTAALTLGAEAEIMPGLKFGAAYRSRTDNTFSGNTVLRQNGHVIGTAPFKLDMDLPGFVQVGGSFGVLPNVLTIFADLQWNWWKETDAFGRPSVLRTPGLVAPGILPAGLNGLRLDYNAKDTVALRLGAEYKPPQFHGLALRAGYWFDPSPFPDKSVDIITYSSDRNIFSAGLGLDQRNATGTGFKFDLSAQLVSYADRHRSNLPGLTPGTPTTYNPVTGPIAFDPASGLDFNYGGYLDRRRYCLLRVLRFFLISSFLPPPSQGG